MIANTIDKPLRCGKINKDITMEVSLTERNLIMRMRQIAVQNPDRWWLAVSHGDAGTHLAVGGNWEKLADV